MNRAKFALLIVAGCAAAIGCRMCAHPYDCHGPTWLGCPGEPTWEFERAGSAFSGHGIAGPHDVYIEGGQQLEAVPARPTESQQQSNPMEPAEPNLMPPIDGTDRTFPNSMTTAPQHPRPTRSALRNRR